MLILTGSGLILKMKKLIKKMIMKAISNWIFYTGFPDSVKPCIFSGITTE